MKNLKIVALLALALTSGTTKTQLVTYEEGTLASQIICGTPLERQVVENDMLAQQGRYKRPTQLFVQPMTVVTSGGIQGQPMGDCYWYRLVMEAKEQVKPKRKP